MATAAIAVELTCPVCLEYYKDPRVLPCQHSLCKSCLVALLSKKETDSNCDLQCPCCRYNFHAENEAHIDVLPKNFTLASIVCKFQASVQKDKVVPCDLCDEDQKGRAIKKCLQCQLYYCKICVQQLHPKKGALANHMLVHIVDAEVGKNEHQETKSAMMSLVSGNQTVSTDKYDLILRERYCLSCDEMFTEGDQMTAVQSHINHDTTEIEKAFIIKRKSVEEKNVKLRHKFEEVAQEMERMKMAAEKTIQKEMKTRVNALESRSHALEEIKRKIQMKITSVSELSSFTNEDASIFFVLLKKLQKEIEPVAEDYIKQEMKQTGCDSSLPIEQVMNNVIATASWDICTSKRRLQAPDTGPAIGYILPKHMAMSINVTNNQKEGIMSADVEWWPILQAVRYEVSYHCNPEETVLLKTTAGSRLTHLRWNSTYTIKVTAHLQDGTLGFDEHIFTTDPQVKCYPMAVSDICNIKVNMGYSFDGFTASNRIQKWVDFREDGEFSGVVFTPELTEEMHFWTMNIILSIFEERSVSNEFLEFGIVSYDEIDNITGLTSNDAAYSCSISTSRYGNFHLKFETPSGVENRQYQLQLKLYQKEYLCYGFMYDQVKRQFAVMDCLTQKVLHVFNEVTFNNNLPPIFAVCPYHEEVKMRVEVKLDHMHCSKENVSYWIQQINAF
ncbi:hypothetical protein ACJMK2_039035 [Sinanodonta woodiana]|uniref:RING-type domain-containing protein n=1 Tax=Sinanodonta woodiana TaxID=1069815 RepID=A0ABD3WAS2_SINWO